MKQKKVAKTNFKRYSKLAACVAIGVVVICQLVFDVYVLRGINAPEDSVISDLIVGGVESSKKPAPVDPVTGKIYFPELRLRLPAETELNGLRYAYVTDDDSNAAPELQVTSQNALRAAESKFLASQVYTSRWHYDTVKAFSEVPNLQRCGRGVHVFFDAKSAKNSGLISQGTHSLHDGRVLYLYTESPTCLVTLNPVIKLLEQAESY